MSPAPTLQRGSDRAGGPPPEMPSVGAATPETALDDSDKPGRTAGSLLPLSPALQRGSSGQGVAPPPQLLHSSGATGGLPSRNAARQPGGSEGTLMSPSAASQRGSGGPKFPLPEVLSTGGAAPQPPLEASGERVSGSAQFAPAAPSTALSVS